MKIAYFVNQYPKVSHSFIRREILALERLGFTVLRVALRGWNDVLPDVQDRAEQDRTRYLLRNGILGLIGPSLAMLLRSPRRFLFAVRCALIMARDAERPLPFHLICLAEACRLLGWLEDFQAEWLHVHFGTNSAEIGTLVRCLGGPPFSFTAHGPEEFQRPMSLPEKIHAAAFVVAISSFGRSQLYLRCPYEDWHKIQVVHCGLEADFYSGATAAIPAIPRFVCVGRLCEAKGQLLLISAIARLRDAGIRAELVLAGDGPLRAQIERLIRRLEVGDLVRITGWISSNDVRREIVAARALVLPSFSEGLPVVIMEAMALRRPVLSTYIAGIPELVCSGETGWLFAAGSVDDLVDAMRGCLAASAEDLERMGESGYQRVTERHAIDTEARKLSVLFKAPLAA